MSTHRLAGTVSVDASARRIREYRWIEERLMRMLGGWIALTPELPIKLLFGRHVWDCAQHADLWGRRLPELRAPAHDGQPPSEAFARLLERMEGYQDRHESVQRVVAVYRVLKPHLVSAYERHLREANPVYEPPTRRILARCLDEERRHVAAGAVILERFPAAARSIAAECERDLRDELGRAWGGPGAGASAAAAAAGPDPTGDLVALDSTFDPTVVEGDLAEALEGHRRALEAADVTAISSHVVPKALAGVLAMYRTAGAPLQTAVVACARIGGFRLVKLALRGSTALSIVQLEWHRVGDAWQIVAGEVVRSEAVR